MKRTPLVFAGTVVGLVGVLSFHSTPAGIALGTLGGTPAPTTRPSNGGPNTTPTSTSSPPTTQSTTPNVPSGTYRSATGTLVDFYFGKISVKVSTNGSKITKVAIASLKSNDGYNQTSLYIDQQAIPMLKQQTLAAQSSNIQGVSGASYTSTGFYRSLQSALGQLGIK